MDKIVPSYEEAKKDIEELTDYCAKYYNIMDKDTIKASTKDKINYYLRGKKKDNMSLEGIFNDFLKKINSNSDARKKYTYSLFNDDLVYHLKNAQNIVLNSNEIVKFKMFENVLKKIKNKNYVELMKLFENTFSLNSENFMDKFDVYINYFRVDSQIPINSDMFYREIFTLMSLYMIKNYKEVLDACKNLKWETKIQAMMSEGMENAHIKRNTVPDEYKKYFDDFYKDVNNEKLITKGEDLDVLFKHLDNPAVVKSLFRRSNVTLSKEQVMTLIDKVSIDSLDLLSYQTGFCGRNNLNRLEIIRKIIRKKYDEKDTSLIMDIFDEDKLKPFLPFKDKTKNLLDKINLMLPVVGDKKKAFNLVYFYPNLVNSITDINSLDSKDINSLKRLSSIDAGLYGNPSTVKELDELLSAKVKSYRDGGRKGFQPATHNSIDHIHCGALISKDGNIRKENGDYHAKMVSRLYDNKVDISNFFNFLVEEAFKGNITILTEEQISYVYFSENTLNPKQVETYRKYIEDNLNNESYFRFLLINVKGKDENNDYDIEYIGYDDKIENLITNSDVIKVFEDRIYKKENGQSAGRSK